MEGERETERKRERERENNRLAKNGICKRKLHLFD
jgi:hypothetical protein